MKRSLADFSKGAVIPKYEIVEMTRSPRASSFWFFLFASAGLLLWAYLATKLQPIWLALPLLLMIMFEQRIRRKFYRWRTTGMLTLGDEAMTIKRGDRMERIQWNSLRELRLWTVVPNTSGRNAFYPQFALIAALRIRTTHGDEELLVLNQMHLTTEDQVQFMEPPPTLGFLMLQACKQHGIKATTKRGEKWSDWFDAR